MFSIFEKIAKIETNHIFNKGSIKAKYRGVFGIGISDSNSENLNKPFNNSAHVNWGNTRTSSISHINNHISSKANFFYGRNNMSSHISCNSTLNNYRSFGHQNQESYHSSTSFTDFSGSNHVYSSLWSDDDRYMTSSGDIDGPGDIYSKNHLPTNLTNFQKFGHNNNNIGTNPLGAYNHKPGITARRMTIPGSRGRRRRKTIDNCRIKKINGEAIMAYLQRLSETTKQTESSDTDHYFDAPDATLHIDPLRSRFIRRKPTNSIIEETRVLAEKVSKNSLFL